MAIGNDLAFHSRLADTAIRDECQRLHALSDRYLTEVNRLRRDMQDLQDRVHKLEGELLTARMLASKAEAHATRNQNAAADLRVEILGLRERLAATIADTIETWHLDYGSMGVVTGSQCTACRREAPTPEAIRHVAGDRIEERPCEYLLIMKALGKDVLSDDERP